MNFHVGYDVRGRKVTLWRAALISALSELVRRLPAARAFGDQAASAVNAVVGTAQFHVLHGFQATVSTMPPPIAVQVWAEIRRAGRQPATPVAASRDIAAFKDGTWCGNRRLPCNARH
jgi:hypothetical protein